MLIPSGVNVFLHRETSLSRRVNANSQPCLYEVADLDKLIKKGEC